MNPSPLAAVAPQSHVTEPPPGAIVHARCGSWWTGLRAAHCAQCHRTLSSTTAFDRHQRDGENGPVCLDPATVGLVAVEKPYGVLWSWPSSDDNPHAKPTAA